MFLTLICCISSLGRNTCLKYQNLTSENIKPHYLKNILPYSCYFSIFKKEEKSRQILYLDFKIFFSFFFLSALYEEHDKRTPHLWENRERQK